MAFSAHIVKMIWRCIYLCIQFRALFRTSSYNMAAVISTQLVRFIQ